MSQHSGFYTTIEGLVEHYNRSVSVFDAAGVLGVDLNEHVDEHPIQPHMHFDARAYYLRV